MAASEWGDELMLQMLAQVWQRSICVISPIAVQTFYPGGFMVNGADPNAVWVGHVVDWHYYGVLRGEDLVVPANRGRGMPLLVRQRQDGACGGRGKRRFLRPPKSGKRRQTGGTEGREKKHYVNYEGKVLAGTGLVDKHKAANLGSLLLVSLVLTLVLLLLLLLLLREGTPWG